MVCKLLAGHIQLEDYLGMANKMNPRDALVSTGWLHGKMKEADFKKNYRIIDATWDLPSSKRNFTDEHKSKRIPGAKYFRYGHTHYGRLSFV